MILRLFAVLLCLAMPAAANARCSVALVLALDVSSSVDQSERELQVLGLADAFRNNDVIGSILTGPGEGIMVSVYQWSGIWNQDLLIDWTWLGDREAIHAFADRLGAHQANVEQWPTALGRATEFAAVLHQRNPRHCARRVIDVSGDGVNNHGVGPSWYRARGDFEGMIINGLVIQGESPDPLPYYRDFVIHGPGAFIEIADGYADYARAIKRKLLRELSPVGLALVQP